MTYRRSKDEAVGSSRWRLKHRSFLLRCGLPDEIVSSDRRLTYVLLHGDDELMSGWNTTWLTDEGARDLLAFLESELDTTAGYDLVAELRRRRCG